MVALEPQKVQANAHKTVVMVYVTVRKLMRTAQLIAMKTAVEQVRFLTVLMMTAVQNHGLVMVLKTAKIRRMAAT